MRKERYGKLLGLKIHHVLSTPRAGIRVLRNGGLFHVDLCAKSKFVENKFYYFLYKWFE